MVPSSETESKPTRKKGYTITLAVAAVVVLGLIVYSVSFSSPSTSPGGTSISNFSASYGTSANSVIVSASQQSPGGYGMTSSKQLNASEPGLQSDAFAVFTDPAGSVANMTIYVFNDSASAQAYMSREVTNSKELSGYTSVTPILVGYEAHGSCYGFGQNNPFGAGAVATGICTKGNVYIQVHLASASDLLSLEGDLTSLVGAAYQGVQ